MIEVNEKFAEAREQISDAVEFASTTYFTSEVEEAEQLVDETLTSYGNLLASFQDQKERERVALQMDLKMEQLKEELKQLKSLFND